eukprot:gene40563-23061_t
MIHERQRMSTAVDVAEAVTVALADFDLRAASMIVEGDGALQTKELTLTVCNRIGFVPALGRESVDGICVWFAADLWEALEERQQDDIVAALGGAPARWAAGAPAPWEAAAATDAVRDALAALRRRIVDGAMPPLVLEEVAAASAQPPTVADLVAEHRLREDSAQRCRDAERAQQLADIAAKVRDKREGKRTGTRPLRRPPSQAVLSSGSSMRRMLSAQRTRTRSVLAASSRSSLREGTDTPASRPRQ